MPKESREESKGMSVNTLAVPSRSLPPRAPACQTRGELKPKGSHKIPAVFIFPRSLPSKTSLLNTATEARRLILTTWPLACQISDNYLHPLRCREQLIICIVTSEKTKKVHPQGDEVPKHRKNTPVRNPGNITHFVSIATHLAAQEFLNASTCLSSASCVTVRSRCQLAKSHPPFLDWRHIFH